MRVLVTGASGFIGRRVVERLAALGHTVTAVSRGPVAVRATANVAWRTIADLRMAVDWAPLLQGVDGIVHLAGIAHVPDGDEQSVGNSYQLINVDSTLSLAHAAAAAGVKRFVFMSSVRVHGDPIDDTPLRASDHCEPADAYGRSKLDAEQGLARIALETGLEIVVLRPPLVYGPGVRANFLRMIEWIDRGRALPFGRVANRRSLIHIDNLSAAIEQSLTHAAAGGKTFLVSDGEDVSTAELARRIGVALGRPARLINVPPRLMQWGLRCLGRGADYRRLFGSVAIDAALIRAELGFNPPVSLADGLADTARWYREQASKTQR